MPNLRSPRPGLASIALAITGLAVLTGSTGASASPALAIQVPAVQAPTEIKLPAATQVAGVAPDGSIRALLGPTRRGQGASMRRMDAAGLGIAPLVLMPPAPGLGFVLPAFTPDGYVVAYDEQPKASDPSRIFAVSVSSDGARGPAQQVSTPGQISSLVTTPLTGPTGAVFVMLDERPRRGKTVDRLVFRPAGGTRFGKPLTVGNSRGYREVGYRVFPGPDGGAVLLGLPLRSDRGKPFVQRLSPAGALGPKVTFPVPKYAEYNAQAAFGPTGTFVAVVATRQKAGAAWSRTQLLAMTLPAGATKPTALKAIAKGSYAATANGNLAITVGAGDHTVVLAGSDLDTDDIGGKDSDVVSQRIFEGTGADLSITARLTAWLPNTALIDLAADGAITAVWNENKTESAAGKHLVAGIYGTRRPAGGTFGTPRLLSTESPNDGDAVEDLTPLSGGRVAVQYRRYGPGNDPGASYVLFATP